MTSQEFDTSKWWSGVVPGLGTAMILSSGGADTGGGASKPSTENLGGKRTRGSKSIRRVVI